MAELYGGITGQNWICPTYTALLSLPFDLLGALWGELYLINTTALTRIETAHVISMLYLGKIVAGPLLGWLSDRIRLRKVLMVAGSLFSLILCSCLLTVRSYLLLINIK